MNRRTSHRVLSGALASKALRAAPGKHCEPTWESIRTHTMPDWYDDAKMGIFIHCGLYSVPAWAPPSGELGKVVLKRLRNRFTDSRSRGRRFFLPSSKKILFSIDADRKR